MSRQAVRESLYAFAAIAPLDGEGWHKSKRLPVPERLRLELLPAYTPEFNPTEHVWDEIREKGFANRFFATLDDV